MKFCANTINKTCKFTEYAHFTLALSLERENKRKRTQLDFYPKKISKSLWSAQNTHTHIHRITVCVFGWHTNQIPGRIQAKITSAWYVTLHQCACLFATTVHSGWHSEMISARMIQVCLTFYHIYFDIALSQHQQRLYR